jgi:hypothetical protein
MIFLERKLQGSALHGRVEFKVAGQGGLVAAAARTHASPPTSRFTFTVRATIHNDTSLPQLPQYTHTRIHAHAHAHAYTSCLSHGRSRTSAPGPLLLPSPQVEGSPARFELCSGASSRQVFVIGSGRRSKSQSDRWVCGSHVHTTPRRRPPPFLGTR